MDRGAGGQLKKDKKSVRKRGKRFEEKGAGGRLNEDKRTVLTMSLRTDVRMGGCGGQEVCTHYVYEGGLVGRDKLLLTMSLRREARVGG